jgi:hypothetical protein
MIVSGLPLSGDSTFNALKAFATANPGLKIIGLIDAGEGPLSNPANLLGLYAGANITLSASGNLGKAAGNRQLALAQWLTHKEHNLHFDRDAEPGTRFFVDETGRLYAVIGAQTPWQSPIFEKILNAKPPLSLQ